MRYTMSSTAETFDSMNPLAGYYDAKRRAPVGGAQPSALIRTHASDMPEAARDVCRGRFVLPLSWEQVALSLLGLVATAFLIGYCQDPLAATGFLFKHI